MLASFRGAELAKQRYILPGIIVVMALFASHGFAQSDNFQVNLSMTGSGSYAHAGPSDSHSISLSGTGQITGFGAVSIGQDSGITEVQKGSCTVSFTFTLTGAPPTYLGVTLSPGASFLAYATNQDCGPIAQNVGASDGTAPITAADFGTSPTGTIALESGTGSIDYTISGGDHSFRMTFVGSMFVYKTSTGSSSTGSTGAGPYPTVAGPGGSGYPGPQLADGADGGSALLFDGEGDSSSARPASHVAGQTGASLQILLPTQSVSANYTVDPHCANAPDCWITIPNATGSIQASSSGSVTANVRAQQLSAGVYPADVDITITPTSGTNGQPPTATNLKVPLTAIVTPGAPVLGLSQTGLQFQAWTGQSAPAAQSVWVSNQGSGSLTFSATPVTSSGGSWLTTSAASATVTGFAPTAVGIGVNPAGLAPGVYFGRVDFTAQGAVNAPQSAVIALTVMDPPSTSVPNFSPSGLIFAANGSANIPSQTLHILNASSQPLSLNVASFSSPGWLQVTPATGTATYSQPLAVEVAVNPTGVSDTLSVGAVHLQDNSGNFYAIPVWLIVPSPAPCTPTRLFPMPTNLRNGFEETAGIPIPLEIQIFDDCGSPLNSGSVVASFSSGDPSVSLTPIGNGQWAGTWMPAQGSPAASVTVDAFSLEAGGVQGSAVAGGTIAANPTAPSISLGGVVSAASLAPNTPIAPGSYISIFGANLASSNTPAPSLPLSTSLGNTQVILGGVPLPLGFAGPNQINALVTAGVPVNGLQQLVVVQDQVYSLPETLVVAAAQPAVFTQNQSGSGPGAIEVVKPDGSQFLNTASAPASAGDVLVIYCAGLGSVNPPVPDGAAAPSSPLSRTVNPVTVTIGDHPAQVSYAGLAPGYVGLYQVNVTVPSGITPSASIPMVLTVAGQVSPPVTVVLQ